MGPLGPGLPVGPHQQRVGGGGGSMEEYEEEIENKNKCLETTIIALYNQDELYANGVEPKKTEGTIVLGKGFPAIVFKPIGYNDCKIKRAVAFPVLVNHNKYYWRWLIQTLGGETWIREEGLLFYIDKKVKNNEELIDWLKKRLEIGGIILGLIRNVEISLCKPWATITVNGRTFYVE